MYTDAVLLKKKKRYQKMLERNKPVPSLYCITLPVNGKNIMEIYSAGEFWFQWYRQKSMTVIGLAGSRENARKLAAQICLDIVELQGDITPEIVRCYFLDTAEQPE